jgi:hypothetical protein
VDDLVPDPPPDDPPRLLVTGDESFPGDGAVGEGERPKVGLVEAAVDDDAGGLCRGPLAKSPTADQTASGGCVDDDLPHD